MRKLVVVAVFLATCSAVTARAATITYTNSAAFFAALGANPSTTETYEGLTLNSIIADGSTVNGITYNSFPANTDGRIDTLYNRIGNQSLALQRGADNAAFFFGGDFMTVTFPFAVNAVGIFFNANTTPLNSLQIQTAVGNAGNGSVYDQSTLFFVGLISDTSFNSATIGGIAGASAFNLDNLTYVQGQSVPVPDPASTMLLLGTGLAALTAVQRIARRSLIN